mmetsp:Transcript_2302/g.7598  ORF Transcript_2302/g.7598 Transcript_2302/m.7598 type:complete len:200 (+) Transcript_2302:247-846(+)
MASGGARLSLAAARRSARLTPAHSPQPAGADAEGRVVPELRREAQGHALPLQEAAHASRHEAVDGTQRVPHQRAGGGHRLQAGWERFRGRALPLGRLGGPFHALRLRRVAVRRGRSAPSPPSQWALRILLREPERVPVGAVAQSLVQAPPEVRDFHRGLGPGRARRVARGRSEGSRRVMRPLVTGDHPARRLGTGRIGL